MGRRPGSTNKNIIDKTPTEKVEDQSFNGNMKSPRALDLGLENLRAKCGSPKIPNQSVKGVVEALPAKISPPPEYVNREDDRQKKQATYIKKKSKTHGALVRRSERIKSTAAQTSRSSRGPEYIEDLTVSDSEHDEQDNQMEKELVELEPELEPAENPSEKSLNEKVDYALHKLDVLDRDMKFLISKVDGNVGASEAPSNASLSFRSLYISSELKVEALRKENQVLNAKLENALGKIEVYENGNLIPIEVLDKVKDAIEVGMAQYPAKTTEAAVNTLTPTTHKACSASAPKRKRNEG